MDLGTVGLIERDRVIDGLRVRIDALAGKLGPYLDDPSSLHPVNLEPVHLAACRLRYYMQQYVLLNTKLAGKDLAATAERRTKADNLWRHTTSSYRSRDLDSFKDVIAARLKELLRREGILWPENFEHREPAEVSTGAPK